jgi:hypothetical protein
MSHILDLHRTQFSKEEAIEWLKQNNAEFKLGDECGIINVLGPKPLIDELNESQAWLTFPYLDSSH